jgi:hypothetical protein
VAVLSAVWCANSPRSLCASQHKCRGCHVCAVLGTRLHSNLLSRRGHAYMSAQKVRMEDAQPDNNAIRGHMMPVPVYGWCHCSPERRFCLPFKQRSPLSPSPHLYKYPQRVAQPYSPSSSGFFHLAILLLSIRFSLPGLGFTRSVVPSTTRWCCDAKLYQIWSSPNLATHQLSHDFTLSF